VDKANIFQKEFGSKVYSLQRENINRTHFWKYKKKYCIWHANGGWRVGNAEDLGTEKSALFAPGMKDDLPGDLRGRWSYWNPDKNEWIKAIDDIVKVKWYKDPVNI